MEITCRTPGQQNPLGHVARYEFVPAVRVVSVSYVSDHGKLLRWKDNWGNGEGSTRFPKPEWTIENMACRDYGSPVSHSMDRTVVLEVTIRYEPSSGSRTVKGDLVGLGPDSMTFVREGLELRPGDTVTLRLSAIGEFQRKMVYRVPFRVEWRFWTEGILALETVSINHLFLTINEPRTVPEFPGVTLLRMHHAVEQIRLIQEEIYSFLTKDIEDDSLPSAKRWRARTVIQDPHELIKRLVYRKLSAYDPNEHHANAWVMANPGTRGNCDTIARYVRNIAFMVGMPGQIEAVRVWPRLNDTFGRTESYNGKKKVLILDRLPSLSDFTIVETPIKSGGLDDPIIRHPTEPEWTLALIDGQGIDNNFEACVKLNHMGTKYYLPGASWDPGVGDRNVIIPRMFKSLSWVKGHEVVGEVARFR